MPVWAMRNIQEFRRLNPAYSVMTHGEEVLLPELAGHYQATQNITLKSDLLRYSALRRYGGWYFDTDFWPFRPISEIVNAYGLDGSRMFISKQQGNRNPEWTHNNSPIACGQHCEALSLIIEAVKSRPSIAGAPFGPKLIKEEVARNARNFIVADAQWFFPANYHDAAKWYNQIISGYTEVAYAMDKKTGGQKPFAMHLWASGNQELTAENDDVLYSANPGGDKFAGVIVGDLFKLRHAFGSRHTMDAIIEGFENLGYCVEVRKAGNWPCFSRKPDVLAVWNGMREPFCRDIDNAEREGIPVLRVENGFWDRKNHCHIDHAGILHWSSWARQLTNPAPAEGKGRFKAIYPQGTLKQTARPGYILVIGQVAGDTQMLESEYKSSREIELAVCRAISDMPGVQAVFRPHPHDHGYKEREQFLPLCEAATIEEAISGAKFAVMINSNSGVECLALGCPVLCLGPATYAMAGAAKQTTAYELRNAIIEMLKGWLPKQSTVDNYLYWLAARQWHYDEVRNTDILNKLLEAAK